MDHQLINYQSYLITQLKRYEELYTKYLETVRTAEVVQINGLDCDMLRHYKYMINHFRNALKNSTGEQNEK